MAPRLNYSIPNNGKTAQIIVPSPNVIAFPRGEVSFVLKDPNVRELRQALNRHMLPPEDSPFTAGSKVRQMAEEMRSVGKELERNIQWLIEVCIPRLMISEDGVMPLQELNFRNSSIGQFLLNSGVSARNNDPIMGGESILTQHLTSISGVPDKYLPFFTETEMATLAVSVLRASLRDAVVTETVHPSGSSRMSIGIFFGQDELVNFCFSQVHPDFNVLALYGDSAVKSMLVLESAENMFKRLFMTEHGSAMSAEQRISMIRTRAELSVSYWAENPVIPRFLQALDQS